MWDSVLSCCGVGAKIPPLHLKSGGNSSKPVSTRPPRDLIDRWGAQLLSSSSTTASGESTGQSAQDGILRQPSQYQQDNQSPTKRQQSVATGASEWGKLNNTQPEKLISPRRKSDAKIDETPQQMETDKLFATNSVPSDKRSRDVTTGVAPVAHAPPFNKCRRDSSATVDGLTMLNTRLTDHVNKLEAELHEKQLQLLATTDDGLQKPSFTRPQLSTVSLEDIGTQEWLEQYSELTAQNPITNQDFDSTLREGKAIFSQSDFEGAALYFQHALTLGAGTNKRRQQARAQANLANALAQHGKLWAALRNLKGALGNIRAMGDAKLESYVLNTGILICVRLERLDEALGFALRKLGVSESPRHKEEATMWIDKINKAMNGEITLNVGQMG